MIAHLVNTDIGGRGILSLYLDYRRRNFNFLRNAAEIILKNPEKVLVVTGFPIPPRNVPETDGPPGALAIAKAVERMGGRAEILSYPEVEAALGEFNVNFVRSPRPEDYSAIVAVETPGRGKDGKARSMSGIPVERDIFDWVFIEAKELGIPTIGIGDGGNEVGMGKIKDLVVEHIPKGELIASTVETDELITSAVSNWGAYGLVAQLSIETGENLLSGWDEREVVRALVRAGIIDGVSKRLEESVDGIPIEIHEEMFKVLTSLIGFRL